jgi:hypothetical protein
MLILLGSQQDLWLAGRSERPHKVAGSWPDGLHVASSCNSRAVRCLIRVCSVQDGRVTWDQHEGEGRTARYIRVDNAPAVVFQGSQIHVWTLNRTVLSLCFSWLLLLPPGRRLDAVSNLAPNAALCILQKYFLKIIVALDAFERSTEH